MAPSAKYPDLIRLSKHAAPAKVLHITSSQTTNAFNFQS